MLPSVIKNFSNVISVGVHIKTGIRDPSYWLKTSRDLSRQLTFFNRAGQSARTHTRGGTFLWDFAVHMTFKIFVINLIFFALLAMIWSSFESVTLSTVLSSSEL